MGALLSDVENVLFNVLEAVFIILRFSAFIYYALIAYQQNKN